MDEQRFLDRLFARVSQPWVTIILVAVNLLAFLVLVAEGGNPLHFNSALLIGSGALYGPAVLQGETWRLFSAMFLHGGLLHIALNMFALWQAGAVVERLFGHKRYLLVYLGAGLIGAFTSLWWKPSVLSVGASGAIFGLYGALLGYIFGAHAAIPPGLGRALRSSALAFIGFSLFAGFVVPGIDNAAHIGGLVGGLLLGYGLARPLDARFELRAALRTLVAVTLTGALAVLLWTGVKPAKEVLRRQLALEQSARLLAMTDHALARRTAVLVEAFLDGTIDPEAAQQGFEKDLLPRWNAQIAALNAQAPGDPRREILLAYAAARRNAVASFGRAAATGDPRWVKEAFAWQQRAEVLMERLAPHPASTQTVPSRKEQI